MSLSSYFFFFQAEDGIRDVAVTGVQTCALPISHQVAPDAQQQGAVEREVDGVRDHALPCLGADQELGVARSGRIEKAPLEPRSEERRVGKECRSRWSPYH